LRKISLIAALLSAIALSLVIAIIVEGNRSQELAETPPLAIEEADSGGYHYSNLLWTTDTDGLPASTPEPLLEGKDNWY
jgi:hypothetical protein